MASSAICYRCRLVGDARDLEACPHCGTRLIVSECPLDLDELEDLLHRVAIRQGATHRLPGVPLFVARRNPRPSTPIPVKQARIEWVTAASGLAAGAGVTCLLLSFLG